MILAIYCYIFELARNGYYPFYQITDYLATGIQPMIRVYLGNLRLERDGFLKCLDRDEIDEFVTNVYGPAASMSGFLVGLYDRIVELESRIKKLEELNNGKD